MHGLSLLPATLGRELRTAVEPERKSVPLPPHLTLRAKPRGTPAPPQKTPKEQRLRSQPLEQPYWDGMGKGRP